MTFPLLIPDPLRQAVGPGVRVLLGLSGGVDSAVTLALLQALGCDVLCVTFKNFCYADDERVLTEKSCCSLEAIDDARRLARNHGARHWVHDLSDAFAVDVIDPFVAEYAAARTPNPCLTCNADVRFPALTNLARQQDCALVATGHYARIEREGTAATLKRGLDPDKDQSYFLHRIPRELLADLVFPLGWYTKTEVRRAAAELGLPVAAKRDSQEICFLPDGDRSFLFGDRDTTPGDIVDRDGRTLGQHCGLVHYTVGQRRGLGIAAPQPLYVLALDRRDNRLIVGYKEELAATLIRADGFCAAVDDFPAAGNRYEGLGVRARIRHRHRGVAVATWSLEEDELEVRLAEPAYGVAPGQGVVLYADDLVLGGGRIVAGS